MAFKVAHENVDDIGRDLIQTLVGVNGRFAPTVVACLGNFHSPAPTGWMSYIAMMAAEKRTISLTANSFPSASCSPSADFRLAHAI